MSEHHEKKIPNPPAFDPREAVRPQPSAQPRPERMPDALLGKIRALSARHEVLMLQAAEARNLALAVENERALVLCTFFAKNGIDPDLAELRPDGTILYKDAPSAEVLAALEAERRKPAVVSRDPEMFGPTPSHSSERAPTREGDGA